MSNFINLLTLDCATEYAGVALLRLPFDKINAGDDVKTTLPSATLCHALRQHISTKTFAARRATEEILPAVRSLMLPFGLSINQLDAIVWNHGPGSFTGIRIAAGIVQGLSFPFLHPLESWQKKSQTRPSPIPLIACTSFESWIAQLALQMMDDIKDEMKGNINGNINNGHHLNPQSILCAQDARAGEVYWQVFNITDSKTSTPMNRQLDWHAQGAVRINQPDALIQQLQTASHTTTLTPTMFDWGLGTGFALYPSLSSLIHVNTKNDKTHQPTIINNFETLFEQQLIALTILGFWRFQRGDASFRTTANEALPLYVRDKVALTLNEQTRWKSRFTPSSPSDTL